MRHITARFLGSHTQKRIVGNGLTMSLRKARSNPHRPELLQQFLGVFVEFYGGGKMPQASEAASPIHERMKEVFKDDPELLEKFEAFMPKSKLVGNPAS